MLEVEEKLQREWFMQKCDKILSKIKSPNSYKYRDLIRLRFGIADGEQRTLEECGRLYGVTRERVRQMECRALSMLRKYFKNLPKDEVCFG